MSSRDDARSSKHHLRGNGPLLVRPATLADIPALERLVNEAYRGDTARLGWTHEAELLEGQRIDKEMLEELLSDRSQSLLVAEYDGEVAGCVNIADKGSSAYLGLLTVAPTRQGGGV